MKDDLNYKLINPEDTISDFIERFWILQNDSAINKEIIVIPDGRIDLIFTLSPNKPFRVALIGLETVPSQHIIESGTIMLGVSLKLLSVEYLIDTEISSLINGIQLLPNDYWGITENDLGNFELFCNKISTRIKKQVKSEIDVRKKRLFELIYTTNGSMAIKALSEKVYWSSRQINRYFTQHFGLSLKSFCKILRFRASFQQIKQGKLFPEQNFSDQAHFIKEVKKLAGVTPKELFKNQNDRFLQLSTLSNT
jgi:AraC-like DNA-binding protein